MGLTQGKFENSDCRLNWRGEIALLDAIRENNIMPLHELRPYLWQDKIGDPFLLTKQMKLYLYSGYEETNIKQAVLGCYSWVNPKRFPMNFNGVICDEWVLDDHLYTFRTNICNLPAFLTLGIFKRRPNVEGLWVKRKKELLGHQILPYKPVETTNPNPGEKPLWLKRKQDLPFSLKDAEF